MALLTTGGGISHGSGSTLDQNLTATYAIWLKADALENGDRLFLKTGGGGTIATVNLNGTTGDLTIAKQGATSCTHNTSDAPLRVGVPTFIAGTMNFGTGANVFAGTMTQIVRQSAGTTVTTGATPGDDSSGAQLVGQNVATQFFSGTIYWAGIWRRNLTLGELQQLQWWTRQSRHIGLPPCMPGCVLYTHYDSTTVAIDRSGAGNHGTPSGSVWAPDGLLRPMPRRRRVGYVFAAPGGVVGDVFNSRVFHSRAVRAA